MDFHHSPAPAVCCLCGDVGFPANLFRCTTCTHRFQHSYCSNYYGESAREAIQVCDWCRSTQHKTSTPARRASATKTTLVRKDKAGQTNSAATATATALSSPRPAPRRYKLLKDVMCSNFN